MSNVATILVALMGYVGEVPGENPYTNRDVLVMFQNGVIQMPERKDTAALNEIVLPDTLRIIFQNLGVQQIIEAAPEFNPSDTITTGPEGSIVKRLNLSNLYRLRFPEGTNLDNVISELSNEEGIVYAERLPRLSLFVFPNDQHFNLQWGLHNTGQSGGTVDADIDAPEAWDIHTGSSSVKIGIIDAGVKTDHEDLSGKVSGETWYVDPHGTHVAGIAAAKTNNNIGIAGVNWGALIHSEEIGSFDPSEIHQDIVDAVNAGSFSLNHSWGGPDYSITIRDAFAYAYKMNRISVAAMRNDNTNQPMYPAAFGQGIIAVGATTHRDERADYSNYGAHIDVAAPGGENPYPYIGPEDIYSTWTGPNDYEYLAGTSMAAPFVTGIAALLKSFNSSLYNDDIERIIRISADDVNSDQYPGWDEYLGTGRVNAYKTLNLLRIPWELHQVSASGGSVHSSTDWYTMAFFSTPGLADGVYIVKRYDIRKTVSLPANFEVTPYAWGRGVATIGFSGANPNFGMGWCNASITGNQITLRTFVYDVYTIDGQHMGWFPVAPGNVVFAYTVLGRRPIDAPSNLSATPSENSVLLTWADNSTNEMGFKIEIKGGQWTDWTEIKTVGQNVTSTTIDGLEFNTTYQFRVRDYAQEFYSDYSNIVSATPNLNPPTNLSALVNPDYSITLTWTDNSQLNTGYKIWRKRDGEQQPVLVADIPDITSWTDYQGKFNRDYIYTVRASLKTRF